MFEKYKKVISNSSFSTGTVENELSRSKYWTPELFSLIDKIKAAGTDHSLWHQISREDFINIIPIRRDKMDPIGYNIDMSEKILRFQNIPEQEGKKYLYLLTALDAILSNKNCPTDIAQRVYEESINLTNNKYFVEQILKRDDLSDKFIEYLVNMNKAYFEEEALRFSYFINLSNEDEKPYLYDVSQNNIDRIAKYLYESGELNRIKYFGPIYYISDKEYLMNVLKAEDYNENIVGILINKSCFTEKERDELFDLGCDPRIIKRFTPHISSVMLEQIWDTLFSLGLRDEYKNNVRRLSRDEFESIDFCRQTLQELLKREVVPESYQIDLANRLLSEGARSTDFITYVLTKYATSPAALETLARLKSKDKDNIYENPHCPKDLMKSYVEDNITKIKKRIKAGKRESKKHIEALVKYGKSQKEIPEDVCKTLLQCGRTYTLLRFNGKIPDNIYKMIIDNPDKINVDGVTIDNHLPYSLIAYIRYNSLKYGLNNGEEVARKLYMVKPTPYDEKTFRFTGYEKGICKDIAKNKEETDRWISFLEKTKKDMRFDDSMPLDKELICRINNLIIALKTFEKEREDESKGIYSINDRKNKLIEIHSKFYIHPYENILFIKEYGDEFYSVLQEEEKCKEELDETKSKEER